MNREIKFRAWHKNIKEMCQNVKTDLLDRDYLEFMQYTGLKDTDEKEIYEGDLVKTLKGLMIITYLKDSFQCVHCQTGKNYRLFDFVYDGCIYVEGNIYENKDLLKQESNQAI